MASTSYALLVDWNGDGDFADTGEVITGRVLNVTTERGRQSGNDLTSKSAAGKLTAIINNESGDYSPFNASSGLYGNLLPGRLVRLVIGNGTSFSYTFPFDFTDTGIWSGYLESITPAVSVNSINTVKLTAVGALGLIAKKEVQLATQTNKRTDELVDAILTSAGWESDDTDLETGQTTINAYWNAGTTALQAIREIEDTEAGFIYETVDGKIKFEDRNFRLNSARSTTSFLTLSDHSSTSYPYQTIVQRDPLPSIYNDFRANIRVVSTGSLATLWTHPETGSSSPLIEAGATNIYWAQYPQPTEGTFASSIAGQVAAMAWTTPAANTDVTVNTASDGSGSNITGDLTIAAVKYSNSMKITLTNGNAADGYITLLKARGTTVVSSDATMIVAEDSDSQDKFFKRTFKSIPKWIPTSAEAQKWTDTRLAIYKDPMPQLSIGWTAGKNANTLSAALDLDISMRITVVAANNSGLGINEDFIVERVQHAISQGGKLHEVRFDLSPASISSGFFSLGTSLLGESTRLWY